jgi:hypothetical protein
VNTDILDSDIQKFINDHLNDNIASLALSKNPFPDVEWKAILNQVAAKAKAKEKLPMWFRTSGIVYPEKISIEQSSSETTAAYKASLVSGNSLIDLTGGFGVDDYFFAGRTHEVAHCELNDELSALACHNFKILGKENIECHAGDGFDTLNKLNRRWDWIYIDPSRRNDAKGKVFMLKDCLPDVPGLLGPYFSFSDNIMIKTSPLLDITAGLSELSYVHAIHIVSVQNEVKELIWILRKGYSGAVTINAVDLKKEKQTHFGFELGNFQEATFALPKKYLFEPNAAVMKSGGFDEVSAAFGIDKLHRHSHLYTSDAVIDNFPGRVFEIRGTIGYSKSEMKPLIGTKANVSTRNFPDSVEVIRKKWKIADGGNVFCFFTTDKNDNKIVLICSKIESQ